MNSNIVNTSKSISSFSKSRLSTVLSEKSIISISLSNSSFTQMLSLSKQIKWYNYRQFFIRKTQYEMKHFVPRPESYYKEKLEEMKRIVLVQNLYSDKLQINGLKYSDPNI